MVHKKLTTKTIDEILTSDHKNEDSPANKTSIFLLLVVIVGIGLFTYTSIQTYH
jgi:hypothetical protein